MYIPSHLTRRSFLGALLSASTFPAWANISSNPDVVVIGAGAAGLAATRTLIERGFSVVTIDARGRIGGRAWTESRTFGVPFDHGCAWIDHARKNPFKAMADKWGFATLNHDNPDAHGFIGKRPMTDRDWAEFDRAWDALYQAILDAGSRRRDVSVASVSPRHVPWIEAAEFIVGPATAGIDVENLSCVDWYSRDEATPHYLVKKGYGALVTRYGRGLPVELNTVAKAVNWGQDSVSVQTNQGTIRARACLVTASTGVLNSGKIRFTPNLPVWKQEAIDGVPMGLLAKIALQFRGTRFGLSSSSWLDYKNPTGKKCSFLCWPYDENLMVGFVGGSLAWDLTKGGSDAAVEFGKGELRKIFGNDVDRYFVKGTYTQWGNDPWAMGAYAYTKLGQFHQRAALRRPVADKVFFAGEAIAGGMAGTCGGAFLSGQSVARGIASVLETPQTVVQTEIPTQTVEQSLATTPWWSKAMIRKFLIGTGMKLKGRTESGAVWLEEYHTDGRIFGTEAGERYSGRWRLKGDLMCWYYDGTLDTCNYLAITKKRTSWWDSDGQPVKLPSPIKALIPSKLNQTLPNQ